MGWLHLLQVTLKILIDWLIIDILKLKVLLIMKKWSHRYEQL